MGGHDGSDIGLFHGLKVLVNLLQHIRGGVAHALHGVEIRDTESEHGGGVVVPEIVKAAGVAGLGAEALPAARDGIRCEGDDESIRRRRGRSDGIEHGEHFFRDREIAVTGIGLGCLELPAVRTFGKGVSDMEDGAGEILPAEGGDFTAAKTEERAEADGQTHMRLIGKIDRGGDLFVFRDIQLRVDLLREQNGVSDIRGVGAKDCGDETIERAR